MHIPKQYRKIIFANITALHLILGILWITGFLLSPAKWYITLIICLVTSMVCSLIFAEYTWKKIVLPDKQTGPADNDRQNALEYMKAKENEIQQLKKLENYRKEFLGNVAHELKTPLTSIQGQILTLLDGGIYDDNININYLQRSAFNIDRMISVVNDLDEISKLEYDRYQLKMENFNISTLIDEVSDTLEVKANKLGIKIITDFNPDQTYMVNADKDNIRKVLVNLIDNAIKYNDKENGEVRIQIADNDNTYQITIADNGIGIDNQYLPRIFERFFRVDKDRSRKTGGSGLGLAIVKHVIDAHSQTLNVQSTPGLGSAFSFTLQKGK
ncbi:MAG: ATP-binding protein [Bacteroidales bacterium]|nr:ATP-binding protein [Bacteroidales bacterium]